MKLNNEEINRYSRHLTLPEVGMEGQLKFKAARILLIGAGGLGSPSGMYLAAAGIGKLGIVDFDVVDSSNLQRQIAHGVADVGSSKVESSKPLSWQEIQELRLKSMILAFLVKT